MSLSPATKASLMSIFILGLTSSVAATANVDQCSVAHTSSGNTFSIHVSDVPDVSVSTICGHSASDIESAASSFSTNVIGDIQCGTIDNGDNENTMSMVTTFDKQSPSVQLEALENGIVAGFGTQGVNFTSSVCNLSGIPTRK